MANYLFVTKSKNTDTFHVFVHSTTVFSEFIYWCRGKNLVTSYLELKSENDAFVGVDGIVLFDNNSDAKQKGGE